MIVCWQVFQSDGFRTEGQLFGNETNVREAVLFCSGFPGMGATLFEQRHAAALVEEGYDVVVLRHKGTRLDSPTAPVMINNAARLRAGRLAGESHLGGGPAMIGEWLAEAVPAIRTLGGQYEKVHIIGNSFGALSAMWSLTRQGMPQGSIKSLILLAGAQGVVDGTLNSIMRIWLPAYMTVPRITDKVSLNDAKDVAETLNDVYKELPGRMMSRLEPHVSLTYIVVAQDEILTLADTENFQAAIGGRGKVIVNTTEHAWPDHGLLAHDTPGYTTDELLKVIKRV